jgi:hypothetical protein
LGCIGDKVTELNNEVNRFMLSNTQTLLSSMIEDSDSPFIFEKIGTQLENIMIDEFQDLKEYLSEQGIGFREIYDGEQMTLQFTINGKF